MRCVSPTPSGRAGNDEFQTLRQNARLFTAVRFFNRYFGAALFCRCHNGIAITVVFRVVNQHHFQTGIRLLDFAGLVGCAFQRSSQVLDVQADLPRQRHAVASSGLLFRGYSIRSQEFFLIRQIARNGQSQFFYYPRYAQPALRARPFAAGDLLR